MRLISSGFLLSGRFDLSVGWRNVLCLLILTYLLMTVGGCSAGLGHDDNVSSVNERIAAEVKLALVKEPDLNAAPIDITVRNGVVTLGGFVEKEPQRLAAEKAAVLVTGVDSVINNIQVK